MYALFEKVDDKQITDKKRIAVTRFKVPPDISANATTIHRPTPVSPGMSETKSFPSYSYDDDDEKSVIGEHILFIFLDPQPAASRDFIGPLRMINDFVQIHTVPAQCLNFLQSTREKIFFMSTTSDKKFIKDVHDCEVVEAIFILNANIKLDKNRYPKLFGVYSHPEEVLKSVRWAHEWYEQTQMNFFSFEHEKIFLWSQLWKEEFVKSTSAISSSDKKKLVHVGEKYYKGNSKLLDCVDDFDCCYNKNDALHWCFSAPFPSRFLNHSLCTRNTKFIDYCRFLIVDVSNVLKPCPNNKWDSLAFRGIKMTKELLDKLVNFTGKLMCPKGFFTCTTSRATALELARAPDYRPDLKPVLFKVYCNSSVPLGELAMRDSSKLIIFDAYSTFRIKWITLGPVSIVDLEPANNDGQRLAQEYKTRFKSSNVQNLLNQLLAVPKPPARAERLPPINRPKSPPKRPPIKIAPKKSNPPVPTKEELEAEKLAERGQFDQAIALYKSVDNNSPHLLYKLANIYAEKKGDFEMASKFYNRALTVQEKKGEDISETLTQLGIAHHNRNNYDRAHDYHSQALDIRKTIHDIDKRSIATNYIGIANAHWGRYNIPDALANAQEALRLNQAIESGNEVNIAMNFAVLANIYHRADDNKTALDYAKRAKDLLESTKIGDDMVLAAVLNNLGTIQVVLEQFPDAEHSFNRALNICKKLLPPRHEKRAIMEKNIKQMKEILKRKQENAD